MIGELQTELDFEVLVKVPEVGYDILDNRGVVLVQAEAAWPDEKFAVVMSDEAKPLLEAAGWRCQTLSEALRGFQKRAK